jgi:hypothetical protein
MGQAHAPAVRWNAMLDHTCGTSTESYAASVGESIDTRISLAGEMQRSISDTRPMVRAGGESTESVEVGRGVG